MKKTLYLLLTAFVLAGAGATTASATSPATALSRADYRQGGYDVSHEIGIDPSDQNKYNLYLMGEANKAEAIHAGDQSQIDYWQGWLDALGPVVIPYPF
jgi:hypothetical protein